MSYARRSHGAGDEPLPPSQVASSQSRVSAFFDNLNIYRPGRSDLAVPRNPSILSDFSQLAICSG